MVETSRFKIDEVEGINWIRKPRSKIQGSTEYITAFNNEHNGSCKRPRNTKCEPNKKKTRQSIEKIVENNY